MRTIKQLIYGFFYAVIFAGIIFWIYSGWFKPAPSCFNNVRDTGEEGIDCGGVCAKFCVPLNVRPIEAGAQPRIFHPTPSSISLMAEIQNPNTDFAAKIFPYKFSLYDNQGNFIRAVEGESFVHASEIKYISEFNLQFPEAPRVATVDFSTGETKWIPKSIFEQPKLVLQNVATLNSKTQMTALGNIINNGNVSVDKVIVFAVFYSQVGQPAGISKSEIDNLAPGEQRAFSVIHPPLNNINLSGTKIYLYGD